jgi:hypothetical protein
MKSFKSIREGNSVEPGVSEINDVPEDPLSFVEIKPKKSKVVKEGIYSSDVERAFPGGKASGVKTGVSAPKGTSTMPKDKALQRAMTAVPKKPADEYDRKVTAHLKKKYNEETEQMDEKVTSKDIKMAVGVAKDKRYAGGNMTGAVKTMEKIKSGLSKHPRAQQALRAANEGVDFNKVWESIKPVHEEIKTTHEDPLVVTKDTEGHIHTHANLSVANAIHGTDVKHQAIHTGRPVKAGKFTFELSKHHEGALKEDAPFDPVAYKKDLDKMMEEAIQAHKSGLFEVSKELAHNYMVAAHKAYGKIDHKNDPASMAKKAKLEKGIKKAAAIRSPKPKPTPKPEHKSNMSSPGAYYASKKPGEYTGD